MVLLCDACQKNVSPTIYLFPCFHKHCDNCKILACQQRQTDAIPCSICNLLFPQSTIYEYNENQLEQLKYCLHCNIKNKAPVEWLCKTCDHRSYCTPCSQPHYESGHIIEPKKATVPLRSQCHNHLNVSATYLCSCQTRLCDYCVNIHAIDQNQDAHQRFPFRNLAAQANDELDKIKHSSSNDLEELQKMMDNLFRHKQSIQQQAGSARMAVANEILEIVNAVMRRGNDIVTQIDILEDSRLKQFEKFEQDIKHCLDRLKKLTSFIDNAKITQQNDFPGIWSAKLFSNFAFSNVTKSREETKLFGQSLQSPMAIGFQSESNDLYNAIKSLGSILVNGVPRIPPQFTPANARMFSISNTSHVNPSSGTVIPLNANTSIPLMSPTRGANVRPRFNNPLPRPSTSTTSSSANLISPPPHLTVPFRFDPPNQLVQQQQQQHMAAVNGKQNLPAPISATQVQPSIQAPILPQLLQQQHQQPGLIRPPPGILSNSNINMMRQNALMTAQTTQQRYGQIPVMSIEFQQQHQAMMAHQQQRQRLQNSVEQSANQNISSGQQNVTIGSVNQQYRIPLQHTNNIQIQMGQQMQQQQKQQQQVQQEMMRQQQRQQQQQQMHQEMMRQQQQMVQNQRQQQSHILHDYQNPNPPNLPNYPEHDRAQMVEHANNRPPLLFRFPNPHRQPLTNQDSQTPTSSAAILPRMNTPPQNSTTINVLTQVLRSPSQQFSSSSNIHFSTPIDDTLMQQSSTSNQQEPTTLPPQTQQQSEQRIPQELELVDLVGDENEEEMQTTDQQNVESNQSQREDETSRETLTATNGFGQPKNNVQLVTPPRQKAQSAAADSTSATNPNSGENPQSPTVNLNFPVGLKRRRLEDNDSEIGIESVEKLLTPELAEKLRNNSSPMDLITTTTTENEENDGFEKMLRKDVLTNVGKEKLHEKPSDIVENDNESTSGREHIDQTGICENTTSNNEKKKEGNILQKHEAGSRIDVGLSNNFSTIFKADVIASDNIKNQTINSDSNQGQANKNGSSKLTIIQPGTSNTQQTLQTLKDAQISKTIIIGKANVQRKAEDRQPAKDEFLNQSFADGKLTRSSSGDDMWDDYCYVCSQGCDESTGSLGCCETCPHVYHARCHVPMIEGKMEDLPDDWRCTICIPVEPLTQQTNGFGEREKLLCSKVFLACFEINSHVELFLSEVPKTEVDYYSIIKKPIWLGLIAERISMGKYMKINQFIEDMNLLFRNFSTFHPPDVPLANSGKKVYSLYVKAMHKNLPAYESKIWIYVSLHNSKMGNSSDDDSIREAKHFKKMARRGLKMNKKPSIIN